MDKKSDKEQLETFELYLKRLFDPAFHEKDPFYWDAHSFIGVSLKTIISPVELELNWIGQDFIMFKNHKNIGPFLSNFYKFKKGWCLYNPRSISIESEPNEIQLTVLHTVSFSDKSMKIRFTDCVLPPSYGIYIESSGIMTVIQTKTKEHLLVELMRLTQCFLLSDSLKSNRFSSFSPVRSNNKCKMYIDGEDYFKDLETCLKGAKKTIFITDW